MGIARTARIAVIAALYTACTLVANLVLGQLSWGPVQFRVSEVCCVLALFTPDAVIGLTIGSLVANCGNIVLTSVGPLGVLDVVFGALATYLGASFTWRHRANTWVALAGPVLANCLIVPAYLPLMLAGLGFYTIPFTSYALDGSYLAMYAFGIICCGIGEAAVIYLLGMPGAPVLRRLVCAFWPLEDLDVGGGVRA